MGCMDRAEGKISRCTICPYIQFAPSFADILTEENLYYSFVDIVRFCRDCSSEERNYEVDYCSMRGRNVSIDLWLESAGTRVDQDIYIYISI